jgi:hypothetical protein
MSIEKRGPGRPKGAQNNNSMTVRLALNKMGFNAVEEFVKAFQMVDDPSVRLDHLKFLFKFIYPQLKEIELTPQDILDMSDEEFAAMKPANMDTTSLLDALKK